ncbi:MAG: hypothetical protein QGH15_14610 [Kiritimatiellia bacterium]|nr:hypothetical protein [Kiritimatiellia bacterium]
MMSVKADFRYVLLVRDTAGLVRRTRQMRYILMIGLMLTGFSAAAKEPLFTGRRLLPAYEPDAYGPLVFPEQVTAFLDHELDYILRRQNKDGSWDSAQPQGNGRTTMQAGGTVDKITLTSMCGYSLRHYPEHGADRVDDAVSRALQFVATQVQAGKLRTQVQDAPWRYTYALRFLVHEYPFVKDPEMKKKIVITAAYILPKLKEMQFVTKRTKPAAWTARSKDGAGGWGYLLKVKGSNTFVSADTLRVLLKARKLWPSLGMDEQMLYPCFWMLSNLRKKQPNSDVESYRYDAAGSFWRVRDIRADVGRLGSAELACLMYSDTFKVKPEEKRTQAHLEKALWEWMKHRGILDIVKFPQDHADYSLAPWCWMYSYRTALEAADYLAINDKLKEKVRRISMNAFFRHMKFYHEPKLGEQGWIIGGDLNKELHDSCRLLDGLATMKHLYQPRLNISSPELQDVMKLFNATAYGEAYNLLCRKKITQQVTQITVAVKSRFDSRMKDIQGIHAEFPVDGIRHLERMKKHFAGYPGLSRANQLTAQWRKELPDLPSEEVMEWVELGPYPGTVPDGLSDAHAWGKILTLGKPDGTKEGSDPLGSVDLERDSIRGDWRTASGQLISPSKPYARIQLQEVPRGSYRLETDFTRIKGDCMGIMFPVGNTSALLVVSGWNGKVSGLAFIGGKDADRNQTTRDGTLTNGVKHTLLLDVRPKENGGAKISVALDGRDYLEWEGPQTSLKPDRQWGLRHTGAIGIGSYNASIVFHSCRLVTLDE